PVHAPFDGGFAVVFIALEDFDHRDLHPRLLFRSISEFVSGPNSPEAIPPMGAKWMVANLALGQPLLNPELLQGKILKVVDHRHLRPGTEAPGLFSLKHVPVTAGRLWSEAAPALPADDVRPPADVVAVGHDVITAGRALAPDPFGARSLGLAFASNADMLDDCVRFEFQFFGCHDLKLLRQILHHRQTTQRVFIVRLGLGYLNCLN